MTPTLDSGKSWPVSQLLSYSYQLEYIFHCGCKKSLHQAIIIIFFSGPRQHYGGDNLSPTKQLYKDCSV